jgi:nitrate reductase gamma subunit
VRINSRRSDVFIITWLMATLILGLLTVPFSIGHAAKGDPAVMLALAEWVKSILLLNPQPELMTKVDPIFRAHIFFGMTVFLVFPFTRLVHILTAPFSYLTRAYQIVRTKRRLA